MNEDDKRKMWTKTKKKLNKGKNNVVKKEIVKIHQSNKQTT